MTNSLLTFRAKKKDNRERFRWNRKSAYHYAVRRYGIDDEFV